MNNSALKLFHELMKKGWIDRNDNSLMWNLVEDNEARDELDQMGIELGFEIIQAQDRIYMVPTQDNDLFLKNNVDYRADIKATNEVRSRDLYLMNYLAIYILFIFFKGEGVDALTGISIAASSSASTEEDKRGNSVKYYTFTTHYDTFSAYSISSLELSSKRG